MTRQEQRDRFVAAMVLLGYGSVTALVAPWKAASAATAKAEGR